MRPDTDQRRPPVQRRDEADRKKHMRFEAIHGFNQGGHEVTPVKIEYVIGGRTLATLGTACERTQGEARRYDPRRGWPVTIGETNASRYISGLDALNLFQTTPGQTRGDWHRDATWWSTTYAHRNGSPETVTLWGESGHREGAPGTAKLRDVRPMLAEIEHPEARRAEPVWAATPSQAVVDLAWNALRSGAQPPSRRDVTSWLHTSDETEAYRIAHGVAEQIDNATLRARWRTWTTQTLRTGEKAERAQPHESPRQPAQRIDGIGR